MTRFVAITLGILLVTALRAADVEPAFDDPALNARYWSLIREIRCPLCMNESIADSGAPVAADLRREVHRLLAEGKSDDEIKDFMSSRYGDFVLYRPRVTPVTYALWASPFVLLVVGSFVFWRILKNRGNQPLGEDEGS
jgi:cytochrome c-type biogenesis protein CcmH